MIGFNMAMQNIFSNRGMFELAQNKAISFFFHYIINTTVAKPINELSNKKGQ